MAKVKMKEKTLAQIKRSIEESNSDKKEINNIVSDRKNWLLLLVCLIIIVVGALERNVMIGAIGGIAFLILLGVTLMPD